MKFTTKALYILAKIVKETAPTFEQCLKELKPKDNTSVSVDQLIEGGKISVIIENLTDAMLKTEPLTIELLSIVYEKPVSEIENTDAFEFIDMVKNFIHSIDWKKLMGKLQALIQKEPQEIIN